MLPIAHVERRTKRDQSKADHNNVYCFLITVFRLAIPAFFSKPDNMLDRRPWLLQLISFLNLSRSMPENMVMTSAYSVHRYRLWDMRKKELNRVGPGREFQTCVAFRFSAKNKQQSCWSKNLDRILLCSPKNKLL